jgi:hypothetical protein
VNQNRLLRNLFVAAAACLLWFGLVSVGTYLTLRLTSAGQLMTDLESAREGRRDLGGVLAGYEDPWTLLVETVPQLLYVVSVAATVATGIFVGGFASGQSSWPPALAAAAVASLLAFIDLTSPANWFRAGAVAVMLWASGFLVMRWRRRRSAAGAA